MSSSSPERYKSRLFNFLNRQSIRLGGEFGKTLRKLKIATEFGVQMMLFPVYLMVQAGRATRQQLPKAQSTKYLTSGELDSEALSTQSDRPIAQILKAVEPLLITDREGKLLVSNLGDNLQKKELELVTSDRNNFQQTITATLAVFKAKLSYRNKPTQAIAIRGVASCLDSRHLVLVDCDNQILDFLNEQQQEQLINFIVARFGREKSQKLHPLQNYTQKFLSALPDLSQNNPDLLPPVRRFWKVINWVQTSPIAINTNLFGESQFTNNSLARANASEEDLLVNKILNSVDLAVANIETQPLVKTGYFFQNLQQQWLTKQANEREPRSLRSLVFPTHNLVKRSSQSERNLEVGEPDPFQINILIKAAIDHFFNQKDRAKSLQSGASKLSSSNSLPGTKSSDRSLKSEPWLSWEDIFSNLKSNQNSQINLLEGETNNRNLEQLPPSFTQADSITQISQQRLPLNLQPQSSQTLASRPQKSQKITIKKDYSAASVDRINQSTDIVVDSSVSQNQQLETAPEWLETEATTVGYVKHPLERLLEWLDLIMLWIENFWAKIWQKLKLINDKP